MCDKKKKILQSATHSCYRYGIRAVSMDFVAQKCRVSKKTVYVMFKNKEQLIKELLLEQNRSCRLLLAHIHHNSANAMDEFMVFFDVLRRTCLEIAAVFWEDLEKYYNKLYWCYLENIRKELSAFLLNNIRWGHTQGLYQPTSDQGFTTQLLDYLIFCITKNGINGMEHLDFIQCLYHSFLTNSKSDGRL